jgi:hypothetical protein
MHCLEHMLVLLSNRIRAGESSSQELADDAMMLAGFSHYYDPSCDEAETGIAKLNDKWHRKYGKKGRS